MFYFSSISFMQIPRGNEMTTFEFYRDLMALSAMAVAGYAVLLIS